MEKKFDTNKIHIALGVFAVLVGILGISDSYSTTDATYGVLSFTLGFILIPFGIILIIIGIKRMN